MTKTLIVVPTQMERQQLDISTTDTQVAIEVCGFGPIAAAARSSQLISIHNPNRVIVVGIAGHYGELEIGECYSFRTALQLGIGIPDSSSIDGVDASRWPQWDPANSPNVLTENPATTNSHAIYDKIELKPSRQIPTCDLLATVCVSCEDEHQRKERLQTAASAEDMESFGIAMACYLNQIPVTVLRGISNLAGDRHVANWKIKQAMLSVSQALRIELE